MGNGTRMLTALGLFLGMTAAPLGGAALAQDSGTLLGQGLNSSQWQDAHERFNDYDRDRNGAINQEEYDNWADQQHQWIRDQDEDHRVRTFSQFDTNGDGRLSTDEWFNSGSFQSHDTNGDGVISRDEW